MEIKVLWFWKERSGVRRIIVDTGTHVHVVAGLQSLSNISKWEIRITRDVQGGLKLAVLESERHMDIWV